MSEMRGKYADLAVTVLLGAAVIAAIFSSIFYVGAYRLVTDIMLNNFGISIQQIGLVGCLVYAIPAFLVGTYFKNDIAVYRRSLLDAELARYDAANSYAAMELPKVIKEHRLVIRLLVGLLVLAAMSMVAQALIGDPDYPEISVDLDTEHNWPDVGEVVVSNIRQPLGTASVLDNGQFVSVMPIADNSGDGSIRLVVEVQTQSAAEGRMTLLGIERSGRFDGYLIKDGLSGQARGILQSGGVRLASPVYALTPDPPISPRGALILTGIAAFIASIVAAIVAIISGRRKAKLLRDLAEDR